MRLGHRDVYLGIAEETMNFQYFFFDTYAGYFLQMVPFALWAGLIVGMRKRRQGRGL